jgi:hypothetical protein
LHTQVVNLRVEPFDVYIGRPSKWGNPYTHLHRKDTIHVSSPEEAVRIYEEWIKERMVAEPEKYNLDELRGKVLGCYCRPAICHGDVLVKLCDEGDIVGNS